MYVYIFDWKVFILPQINALLADIAGTKQTLQLQLEQTKKEPETTDALKTVRRKNKFVTM
jgi:hypothetical protein